MWSSGHSSCLTSARCFASPPPKSATAAEKQNDNENNEDEAEAAGGVIAPIVAVGPSRQRAEQQQDHQNKNDIHRPASGKCAWSTRGSGRWFHASVLDGDDLGADRDAAVEVDDVVIDQPEAAG